MKIHLFFEIIIAFLLILLPLSSNHEEIFVLQPFSIYTIILYFILTAVIFFRYNNISKFSNNINEQLSIKKRILNTFILLIALLINTYFWSLIAKKCNISSAIEIGFNKINFFIYFNFIFGTILAATYEEFLYRFYTPRVAEHLSVFLEDKYGKNFATIILQILELAIIVLFALGHAYSGIVSILNAFCAGIMLRFFVKKISAPIYVISAHSLFNLIQYLFFINTLS